MTLPSDPHFPANLGASPTDDRRPTLVILSNAPAPYRTAFHLRVSRELPSFRLVSVFTHAQGDSPWQLELPPEIGPVRLDAGSGPASPLRRVVHELSLARALLRELEALRPVAVIVNGYNDFARLQTFRWCSKRGIPAFLWGDSNIFSDRAGPLKRRMKGALIRFAVRRSKGVLVCGRYGYEFFRTYVGHDLRAFVSPYEPDCDLFNNPPAERCTAVAARYDLRPGRRRLIYSGRLVREKRVDLLLDAFQRIAADRPEWDLLLVGDGRLRPELEQRVRPEVAARIRFLGFQNDAADVAAIYHHGDALCLPSGYEPWAVVVSEAAAAGLALVTSHIVGASPELVHDGVNGRTFFSGDVDDLTDALLEVTDPDRIDRYRAASRHVLSEWRRRCDPVLGLRKALASVGLLPTSLPPPR